MSLSLADELAGADGGFDHSGDVQWLEDELAKEMEMENEESDPMYNNPQSHLPPTPSQRLKSTHTTPIRKVRNEKSIGALRTLKQTSNEDDLSGFHHVTPLRYPRDLRNVQSRHNLNQNQNHSQNHDHNLDLGSEMDLDNPPNVDLRMPNLKHDDDVPFADAFHENETFGIIPSDHMTSRDIQPIIEEENYGQGQALIILSETLAQTQKLSMQLRNVDNTFRPKLSKSEDQIPKEETSKDSPVDLITGLQELGVESGVAVQGLKGEKNSKILKNMENLLHDHLTKMHESERRAEEHLRELNNFERILSQIRWDQIDINLIDFLSDIWTETEEKKDSDLDLIGWTGETKGFKINLELIDSTSLPYLVHPTEGALITPQIDDYIESRYPNGIMDQNHNHNHDHNHNHNHNYDNDHDNEIPMEEHKDFDPFEMTEEENQRPFSPTRPSSTFPQSTTFPNQSSSIRHDSTSNRHSTSTSYPQSKEGLPFQTQLLLSDTISLLSSLNSLSETLSLTGSIHGTIQRQLRGVKAGVEGLREREFGENKAWDIVEGYDRERVERGLKGDKVGDILQKEVEGFERKLGEFERHAERLGSLRLVVC
ncbi:hypothetical protein TREMEDRAFT_58308 [Tremella mesenterica DSM 1558]|uniref:uncharacterized protein n=1 Tax=Tremella mesenterica (strain ATCC 24925 / CBS 8224 / DSM 1558 / NBRC 9311 / NRRL Y-6157 / RJB 2259-6 / UBC 559-6) TaxID=578456 RepID=UPI0003F498E0|nr:uncharacterized protein TREMEDRAFT_58308 [Tremella mesenterica DSM 1558]EIW72153.1 hypothetical protein TREMEDRAFT_58308 [Tremella mesenterica DSM 1558]